MTWSATSCHKYSMTSSVVHSDPAISGQQSPRVSTVSRDFVLNAVLSRCSRSKTFITLYQPAVFQRAGMSGNFPARLLCLAIQTGGRQQVGRIRLPPLWSEQEMLRHRSGHHGRRPCDLDHRRKHAPVLHQLRDFKGAISNEEAEKPRWFLSTPRNRAQRIPFATTPAIEGAIGDSRGPSHPRARLVGPQQVLRRCAQCTLPIPQVKWCIALVGTVSEADPKGCGSFLG
jgi:hypothetical protein